MHVCAATTGASVAANSYAIIIEINYSVGNQYNIGNVPEKRYLKKDFFLEISLLCPSFYTYITAGFKSKCIKDLVVSYNKLMTESATYINYFRRICIIVQPCMHTHCYVLCIMYVIPHRLH